MKILFAVQATGNGHLSRAKEILPILQEYGEVSLFISGYQSDIDFPFKVDYKKYGLSFIFGEHGGIDKVKTLKSIKPFRLITDIAFLKLSEFDIVINDFEPVTAWACKLKGRKCYSLSHQASFLSANVPRPRYKSPAAEWILKNYAPVNDFIGLHFQSYDERIETPIIRKEIRESKLTENDHVVVYLPAYKDSTLIQHFIKNKSTRFIIFSKKAKAIYQESNVIVFPAGSNQWQTHFSSASGVIMGAGFEGPSEALFMGKKLLIIPMIDQYEQVCNSIALNQMGVMVVNEITSSFSSTISYWLNHGKIIKKDFPDQTSKLIKRTLELV